jgi:hypothetical protein
MVKPHGAAQSRSVRAGLWKCDGNARPEVAVVIRKDTACVGR